MMAQLLQKLNYSTIHGDALFGGDVMAGGIGGSFLLEKEVTGILENIGFEYGSGDTAWAKGDTIMIEIKAPKINNDER